MASLGELFVTVGANIEGFKQAMTDVKASVGEVNGAIQNQILGAMTALGAAAIAAGIAMDDAFDDIRIKTGETGKSLKGLEDSFVNIFGTLPVSSQAASTAIADLNVRLGLTGPALESMATQMLNLARMTGTEVGPVIQSVTRAFGDWSIATDKMGPSLDYLFRVSQATGIGVDRLAQTIVQFGAPLRRLGFDFETAAALIGKFEQEGVNTEMVLAGLKIAFSKMAKEGVADANVGLQQIISSIKGAGTESEANRIAIEAFGRKAGPDMAAAIREGRFELGELLTQLQNGKETINKAAAATDGFKEDLTNLKNQATLVLEPLGTGLMGVLSALLKGFKPLSAAVKEAQKEVAALDDSTKSAAKAFGFMYPMMIPTLEALGIGKKSAEEYSKANEKVQKTMGAVGTAHAKAGPKITDVGTGMKAAEKAAKLLESAYSKLGLKDLQGEAEDLGEAINKLKDSGDWNKLSVDQQKAAMDKYEQAAFKASGKTYDFSQNILALSLQFKNAFTPAEALRMELDGMSTEMQALSSDIRNLPTPKLISDTIAAGQATAEAAGKVVTLQDAYSKLGITAKADLDKVAQEAAEARDAVLGSGTATDFEKKTAVYKALKAQVEAAIAAGETIPAEQKKLLEKMESELNLDKVKGKWNTFSNDVSTIITNFAQDISKSLWDGDMSWGEKGKALLKQLGQSVTSLFIEPATKALGDFVRDVLNGLLGGALDNLGKKFGDIFGSSGSGGSSGGGGDWSGSIGAGGEDTGGWSGEGTTGGSGGGSASGGGSPAEWVNAAAAVISAIYNIRQEGTMNSIEESTRYTKIYLGDLLPKLVNDFASYLPQIHERLMELRTYGIGIWPQEGYGGMGGVTVTIQGNVIGNDEFASDMADLIAAKLSLQGAT